MNTLIVFIALLLLRKIIRPGKKKGLSLKIYVNVVSFYSNEFIS
jgi:hypothetical protein